MNPRPIHILALGLAFALMHGCSSLETLRVESHPPGARILIDGRDSGLVTPADVELSTRNDHYNLRLEKSGYNPVIRDVRLETDVDVMSPTEAFGRVLCAPCCLGLTLPGLLTPVDVDEDFYPNPLVADLDPEGQGVRLTVDPPDAEVYVDGRLRRLLDGYFLVMEAGDHEIEITREGHRTWRRVMYVGARQYNELDVELEVDGQGLLLEVRPAGARLYVDGQYKGVVGEARERVRTTPGPHEVRLELDGHKRFEDVLVVESEQYRQETITLTLAGQGVILRKPDGLRRGAEPQILVDGVLRSTRFDEALLLEPGPYLIEVLVPKYEPWTQKVQVTADQFLQIEIGLDKSRRRDT